MVGDRPSGWEQMGFGKLLLGECSLEWVVVIPGAASLGKWELVVTLMEARMKVSIEA